MISLRLTRRSTRSLFVGAATAAMLVLAAGCSDDGSNTSSNANSTPSVVVTDATAGGTADTVAAPTDSSAPAAGDPRVASVVDGVVADAAEFGVTLDAACVEEQVAQLSEADLALLTAWAEDDDPDATVPALSDEGEAIGEGLNACVAPSDTTDGAVTEAADAEVVEQAVALVVSEEGDSADQVCLRANLGRLSNEQLQILLDEGSSSDNPALDPVFAAVLTCLE